MNTPEVPSQENQPVKQEKVASVSPTAKGRSLKNVRQYATRRNLIVAGVAMVAVLAAGTFWFLTRDTGPAPVANEAKPMGDQRVTTVDVTGYDFLSLEKCQQHFKELGYDPGPVSEACMNLEKNLNGAQASNSKNFEPSPLVCKPYNEDQWYRTDNTLIIDHKDPNTMYVNVEFLGFHKTTDGGKTWTQKTKGIVVDHKSVDDGKPCYGEYPVAMMDPKNNKRLLLATSGGGGGTINDQNMRGGGVYESTDGGESWHQTITDKMNGYTTHALVFDPTNSQSFFYGSAASPASYTEADPNKIWVTKGIIYKTPDNGKNWSELPTGFLKGARLTSIMIDPNNTKRITASTVVLARNASGPNTITDEQMGVIQSLDGGSTWKRIDNLPKNYQAAYQTAAAPKNYNNMFSVASVNGGVKAKSFYSYDAGATWAESSMAIDVFAYDPYDSTGKRMLGYYWQCGGAASCSKTLYQSLDAGKTWSTFGTLPKEVTNLLDKKTRLQNIVWHPTDKNSFYISGANGYVWKTADNGQTYTTLLSVDRLLK